MVKIKICGITSLEDALGAVDSGADALGFVFYPESPRYISPERAWKVISALPPFVTTVGVFVNAAISLIQESVSSFGINVIQLHGEEPPEFPVNLRARTVKAFRVREGNNILDEINACGVNSFLLDSYSSGVFGGTGKVFNWNIASDAKKHGRVILSGGLNPENVYTAIKQVSPYGVDVSSGVEISPGKKDLARIQTFIDEVRRAENAS